jgi:hypothetical protein
LDETLEKREEEEVEEEGRFFLFLKPLEAGPGQLPP